MTTARPLWVLEGRYRSRERDDGLPTTSPETTTYPETSTVPSTAPQATPPPRPRPLPRPSLRAKLTQQSEVELALLAALSGSTGYGIGSGSAVDKAASTTSEVQERLTPLR